MVVRSSCSWWVMKCHWWFLLIFYVLLVSLYVIFYVALLQSNPQTITVVDISPSSFRKLHKQQAETLSCRCTNSTIRYDTFLSNEISLHPICSSIFVTERWIRAFYVHVVYNDHNENFDTTAYSQVKTIFDISCSMHFVFVSWDCWQVCVHYPKR